MDSSDPPGEKPPAAPAVVSEFVLVFAFTSFLIFAVVEMIFAFSSNSLSLLGDSFAMLVDTATYLFNGLAMRRIRATGREDVFSLAAPVCSAVVLVAAMLYILVTAAQELESPGGDDDVAVVVVLAFGLANLVVDAANCYLFLRFPDAFRAVLLFADPESLDADGGLNMRSALTHILADTWRSVACIVAASVALASPDVSGANADAVGALVVEVPILFMCCSIVKSVVVRVRGRRAGPVTLEVPGGAKSAPFVGDVAPVV